MHPLDRLRLQIATSGFPPPGKLPRETKRKSRNPLRPPLTNAAKTCILRPALTVLDQSRGATTLWFDFETYSDLDLKKRGLDNYAKHPSTKPILIAFAFDDHPVQEIDLNLAPMPAFLLTALSNSAIKKTAWNIPFELAICQHCLKIEIPLAEVFDPMALARKLTFPGKLGDACIAIGLTTDEAKDKAGNRLIKMFSTPNKNSVSKIKQGEPPLFRRTESHSPEEWHQFIAYAGRDVESMRTAARQLTSLSPWTAEDHRVWTLDQEVNRRGLPVDLTYVTHADRLMAARDAATLEELKTVTRCDNPNSVPQLKEFCEAEGYPMRSLAADEIDCLLLNVPDLLEHAPHLAPPASVTQALTLRRALSGAGPKKLAAIQNFVSDDLRLRNQHVFHGGRTGRWSGREVQTQNLPRPKPEYEDLIPEFTETIRRGRLPSGVSPADAVTGTIRSSFRAPEGSKLAIADLSSIENRVLAWFAGCQGMLDVFKKSLDPYRSFASLVYSKPYDQVTKAERTSCKPPVLGAGFGMSAPTLKAYAESMGIALTNERSGELIETFRQEYWEVPHFWRNLEAAVKTAISLREIVEYTTSPSAMLVIDATDERVMKIVLPSGRPIFYRQPCIRETMTAWGEMRPTILYVEPRSSAKGQLYGDLKGYSLSHGSKLAENVVQATARDILAESMCAASDAGLAIVGHCHDEIIVESSDESAKVDLALLLRLMSASPAWAADLPVAAVGLLSQIYVK